MINQHGGKRPGAGRPATGPMPTRAIRMTDEEFELVKQFLVDLRSKSVCGLDPYGHASRSKSIRDGSEDNG